MDNGNLALGISVFSVALAAASLGWNIYRDVVLKPQVKVTASIRRIYAAGMPASPEFIVIEATNHGPGVVRVTSLAVRGSTVWRRLTKSVVHGFLMHDFTDPYSSKLPRVLEVGESANYFLPLNEKSFANGKDGFNQVGITDSFGRISWAPKKHFMSVSKHWKMRFPDAPPTGDA